MEDLFELMQGTQSRKGGRKCASKPATKLAGYALKEALGGDSLSGDSGFESSWFDVDHHLAAKVSEVEFDFRGRDASGEAENEELEGKERRGEFDDEF
jgi:hypothetical protein